jgi:hypothetical protein
LGYGSRFPSNPLAELPRFGWIGGAGKLDNFDCDSASENSGIERAVNNTGCAATNLLDNVVAAYLLHDSIRWRPVSPALLQRRLYSP